MSLVVLRSWSDGPPKVRGIAPSDSNEQKYVYVPDHRGQFVTQEVSGTQRPPQDEKVKEGNNINVRRQTWNGDSPRYSSHNFEDPSSATVKTSETDDEEQHYYNHRNNNNNNNNGSGMKQRSSSIGARINGVGVMTSEEEHSRNNNNNERHYKSLSYIDLNSEERTTAAAAVEQQQHISKSTGKNRWANETRKPTLKPKPGTRGSAEEQQQQQRTTTPSRSSSTSPDHDYIHELDSTPPASPMMSGRYRNLGPELAACIPKRQLKFSTNWLRDASPGYQWSHQRRSLSNSTPSLSQGDFYSSEEEKISSFSSQSSSKTSSPQPPSPSIRQLQRQFERHCYKEAEGRIDEEQSPPSPSSSESKESSPLSWAEGARNRLLNKVDKSSSLPTSSNSSPARGNNNYYHRRPRQRQLVSSPSTPPPPPPDQHDYYRSLSTASSTLSLHSNNSSGHQDELDSPGKVRGILGKQLSLSSEDDEGIEGSARGRNNCASPKSDVILVEVIRKKLKAKNTISSGFSASGSDSGSDKDSADSSSHHHHHHHPRSILKKPSKLQPAKSVEKISSSHNGDNLKTISKDASSFNGRRKEEVVVVGNGMSSDDVNENLVETQLSQSKKTTTTATEQIEQDRSVEEREDCVIVTTTITRTNNNSNKNNTAREEPVSITTSSPPPSLLTEESKIIRNRESEVFDSVIAPVESERKEIGEGAATATAAEIQEGKEDESQNKKGEVEEKSSEEGVVEGPPVEIIAPTVILPSTTVTSYGDEHNDGEQEQEAQFSTSSSNSEQNPRLSALPIQQQYTDSSSSSCGSTNQSESIARQTATENDVDSVSDRAAVESEPASETSVQLASRILDQVLTQAERAIEQISSNKSSLGGDNESSLAMDRGKYFEDRSPVASVKIPVQAVNKYVRSDSSDEFESEYIWRNTSVRESFRGFCQELLESSSSTGSSHEALNNNHEARAKATEKIIIHVSQPELQPQSLLPNQGINEGVIEFEDDDDGELSHQRSTSDVGGRAETPMMQCNNSIEYISVRDNVQVNNGAVNVENSRTENKEPGAESGVRNDPQPIKWIITLDLGSRRSGFSYWGHVDQNVVHIGSWSGDNCLHKIPSWILTTSEGKSHKTECLSAITIGEEALDEYLEEGDSKCTFVNQWREFFQLDPTAAKLLTFPYTLDPVEDEMEFTRLISSLVNFFGRAAISQMQTKFGSSFSNDEHIEWLITVPSGWNTHSRQCIREAAYKSSVVKGTDGVNLIEDPIAAAVFAAMCGQYENVLAVDVGGAFMHYSGFSSSLSNGHLVQTLEPRSLQLPTPESNFEQLLTQIVSREFMLYYKAKYKAGWVELLRNFERAKCKFDTNGSNAMSDGIHAVPHSSSSAFVFFPSSFVTEFNAYTGMDLSECIQEQNGGVSWNENGALRIPNEQMKRILKPTVDFVLGKIESALKEYDYDNLVLTGGCAKCKLLNESISAQFPGLKVILPKEFSSGILQGATLSLMPNLQPKLMIKSPFSIGVGVMTPFDPNQHPEEKKIIKDGKTWCADVWDTLIKHGQDIEIHAVVNRRAYVGAQPGQSCLVLPLFKSSAPGVPKLVTDKSVLKCCELRFESTKPWHEIDLILSCRASELIVMAVDRENLVHRVVIDLL